jgi:hypothetical protein
VCHLHRFFDISQIERDLHNWLHGLDSISSITHIARNFGLF